MSSCCNTSWLPGTTNIGGRSTFDSPRPYVGCTRRQHQLTQNCAHTVQAVKRSLAFVAMFAEQSSGELTRIAAHKVRKTSPLGCVPACAKVILQALWTTMAAAAAWTNLAGLGYFERECVAALTCLACLRSSLAELAAGCLGGLTAATATASDQALVLQTATQL